MNSLRREWQNFSNNCLVPFLGFRAILFLLKKVVLKIYQHVTPHKMKYPSQVRVITKEINAAAPHKYGCPSVCRKPSFTVEERIRLATGYLHFKENPPWDISFADPEQTESLHRWNWLLLRLTEERSPEVLEWGLALMRDWNSRMGGKKAGIPWKSYTTAERICNSILFVLLSGSEKKSINEIPEDLKIALAEMAIFLANNLEYKGLWTGNHIINNARALYFSGKVLKNRSFVLLAKSILNNSLFEVVNSDGFIREGSSHYHFLVTRWLLEMIWLGDEEVESFCGNQLEHLVRSMVARCWFFLTFKNSSQEWVMPLIGDISPDFPWNWLIDLPWSPVARSLFQPEVLPVGPRVEGWGSIFPGKQQMAEASPAPAGFLDPRLQAFPESGWYRLDWREITIFWHVEPRGSPLFSSHGHCDTGSFCFFWNGYEILIDPGRYNYQQDDSLGTYGVSARAHNNVLMDGFEPFLYFRRSQFPSFYKIADIKVDWRREPNNFRFSLRHNGFSRIKKDRIIFQREFLIFPDRLEIEDKIEGMGQHRIETYFQWGPYMQVKQKAPNGLRVNNDICHFQASFHNQGIGASPAKAEGNFKLMRGQLDPVTAGWSFPGYGEKAEALTLLYEFHVRLPYSQRYILKWSD